MAQTWRERAKSRMKEIGLTQDSLSERLGMTQGGLQHWLAGTRQPSLEDINRIADELRVPRTWLTHGIDPEDTLDGLNASCQTVLRHLIQRERLQPLPESFWTAITAIAATVAPAVTEPTTHIRTPHSRNGTEG